MKTEYFLNCHTEESIGIRYKSLAKKFHPDVNKNVDTTEQFKEINNQREAALRSMLVKAGKSEVDINEYLNAVFAKDKAGMNDAIEKIGAEFIDQIGDKEPTFADALKFVFGKYTNRSGKNLNGKDDTKGIE